MKPVFFVREKTEKGGVHLPSSFQIRLYAYLNYISELINMKADRVFYLLLEERQV